MSESCCALPPHLVIIGGGSAAFAAAIRAHELGGRITMINDGLPVGGTCVNVGCVPSKNLIRAAEVVHRANAHQFWGIETHGRVANFREIIAQKRELVGQLRQAKYLDVVADFDNFRLIEGRARLTAPGEVEVNGERIAADAIVIATGATPAVPPIPGLAEAGYLTNETAYELEELPESLIVLGGNYIGLENAQMFARFGSRVTVLELLSQILPTEQPDVAEELLRQFRSEGIEVVTGAATRRVYREKGEVVLEVQVGEDLRQFRASQVLVATGRQPNTANMGLETVGVAVDEKGFLHVDDTLQTTVPGIYGAGDVIGGYMFVYTAAYEGKLAAENALSEQKQPRDYTALPWVIFTDPQIAGVGWDEAQARERGIDAEVTVLPLSEVPRAIAARDTRGFIKLIRDRESDKLIGARIVAPEGSELLMEVTLAIKYGLTVNEIVSLFHPYLTLSEGIKLAAISFGKEVSALSCCAT